MSKWLVTTQKNVKEEFQHQVQTITYIYKFKNDLPTESEIIEIVKGDEAILFMQKLQEDNQ